MDIRIKRAYEEAHHQDGQRILVDRVWPRGVSKQELNIIHWLKEVAPSNTLRRWFDHDKNKWSEFKRRYQIELKQGSEELQTLHDCIEQGRVTLVYGAKDKEHNQAVFLREFLREN